MKKILFVISTLAFPMAAWATEQPPPCKSVDATSALLVGFEAQRELRSADAMAAYRECLKLEPACVSCQYEIGWTYWSRGEWDQTVAAWKKTLELDPKHEQARTWIRQARENAETAKRDDLRVPIGTKSEPADAPVKLELVARFQNYNAKPAHPNDHYDQHIYSPKSAHFSVDGSKVYVNSLEGLRTVIYDPKENKKIGTISHKFGADQSALFHGESTVFDYTYSRKSPHGNVNYFSGKPVESELSHGGQYLWVPYYRRDYDHSSTSPSAVAIIDTATDQIVRVMPTGPIPKYVAASPDGNWVAITHWGDNTVALIDTSSGDPDQFKYVAHLVVERRLSIKGLSGVDRDRVCGYCLRGTVFTPDSKTLLVARMGGGGIAGFDLATRKYLGTVLGMKPTPRHLVISPDSKTLYLSSNVSGYLSGIELSKVIDALEAADGKRVPLEGWREAFVGGGARTVEVSPNGRYLFAAVNLSAYVAVVDTRTFKVVSKVRTDSYAVGLDVSPSGHQVWVTSQGRKGLGGNSVTVFDVTYETAP